MALPLVAADPHMTPGERAKALKYLEESQAEFLAAIDGVTDAQWRWKPAPERWSVGEVAEHIVTAEGSMWQKIQTALAAPANAQWETQTKGKTEIIEQVMAPRLGKATAPEPLVPKGDMTKAQVKARFQEQRAEFVKFTRETDAALKEHTSEHPFAMFNPLNAYQWLIYAPLHTMRHDKQIAEVKATAGYPK
uniref:DinB-like domain-containing protein n=1 Tax=Solibacter usitatus (strain Ellin6076) TaxID=234267 RepID=Q01XD8_SOLUE